MGDSAYRGWVGGITADEVRDAWGGELRTIPADAIAPGVSTRTHRFLTEVGLPTGDCVGMTFRHDGLAYSSRQDDRDYLVLTDTIVTALDLASDQVYSVLNHDLKDPHFLNSDLAAFVYFSGMLQQAMQRVDSATEFSEELVWDATDGLRTLLAARDPAAMEPMWCAAGRACWTTSTTRPAGTDPVGPAHAVRAAAHHAAEHAGSVSASAEWSGTLAGCRSGRGSWRSRRSTGSAAQGASAPKAIEQPKLAKRSGHARV